MYLHERQGDHDTEGPAGAAVFVDPDELGQQANRLVELGEDLRNGPGREDVQPPRLGTAPPAVWLTARLAELTAGGKGVHGLLRYWADGLASVGRNARGTARDYRNTDDANAVPFGTEGCR